MKTLNNQATSVMNVINNKEGNNMNEDTKGALTMLKDLIMREVDQVLVMSDGYRIAILEDGSVMAGNVNDVQAGISDWWKDVDIFSLAFVKDILVGLWKAIKAFLAAVIAIPHAIYVWATTRNEDNVSKVDTAIASVKTASTVVVAEPVVVAPIVEAIDPRTAYAASMIANIIEPVTIKGKIEKSINEGNEVVAAKRSSDDAMIAVAVSVIGTNASSVSVRDAGVRGSNTVIKSIVKHINSGKALTTASKAALLVLGTAIVASNK